MGDRRMVSGEGPSLRNIEEVGYEIADRQNASYDVARAETSDRDNTAAEAQGNGEADAQTKITMGKRTRRI